MPVSMNENVPEYPACVRLSPAPQLTPHAPIELLVAVKVKFALSGPLNGTPETPEKEK
jgi:hypothetical protein